MRRLLLLSVSFLWSVGMAQAQDPEQSWDNLRRLGMGEEVQVVDQRLRSVTGEFGGFSEDGITLQTGQGEMRIPREEVLRVTSRERNRRGRNALIGFGVGAAFGAVVGAMAGNALPRAGMAAVAGLVYGGIGAGIGAAFPSHPTIYRTERRQGQSVP